MELRADMQNLTLVKTQGWTLFISCISAQKLLFSVSDSIGIFLIAQMVYELQ